MNYFAVCAIDETICAIDVCAIDDRAIIICASEMHWHAKDGLSIVS